MSDDKWWPWWECCPQKNYLSEAPDFSGLDPETGEPWSPSKVVEILGLRAYNDPEELRLICERAVSAHPKDVEAYRKGKTKVIGKFIKLVMDETKSGADPGVTQHLLQELLRPPESSDSSEVVRE